MSHEKLLSDNYTMVRLNRGGSLTIWDTQAAAVASTFSQVPSITVSEPGELVQAINDLIATWTVAERD